MIKVLIGMFGRALNLVMSVVLAATLLWGGCLSCTQYFMMPAASGARHCCDPHSACPLNTGKEKPGAPRSTRECNIQAAVLSRALTATPAALPSVAFIIAPVPHALPVLTGRRGASLSAGLSDRGSPPDLNLLHSVLRI